ncbi:zinc metalloproteinase-disintegrin-like 8 [Xenia sp. Carnegie-2017]|uniref:zinc metalloproteinase-disintegrin-like 8 n=1 Tax=Xenia sp. Carnegie-2017 TaxID=2897299 RepID=UPI001F035000|nr:zinc metalloproteinase-disintegrin-like 8 [Xenia sp. Carnegie-2017]XP_046851432.1 zinc metalloproteinase-disintegrin-like 8 [Xenia sp. Carnegie-2017]XP_046851433.1 zinc metalloproteinase-disintegrin-like 8 [Xenia sp. Carnegie-2017]
MKRTLCFMSVYSACILSSLAERYFQQEDEKFLSGIKHYEFVEPKLSKPWREVVDNQIEYGDSESSLKRRLSFVLRGQSVSILLTLNSGLLSPNFFERHVTKQGHKYVKEADRDCHFHGHIEGESEMVTASLSTCKESIEGSFTLGETSYVIQPIKSKDGKIFHVVFDQKYGKALKESCGTCGYQEMADSIEISYGNLSQFKQRARRSVIQKPKYIEIVVVNDKVEYQTYGSEVATRAIGAMNYVDLTYKVQNIRVVLVFIETWTNTEPFAVPSTQNQYLDAFNVYKRDVLDRNKTTSADHVTLITRRIFANSPDGLAGVRTICHTTSTSLVTDRSDVSIYGSLLAHELGHSLGFSHISSGCNCKQVYARGECMMNAIVGYSPLKWSDCTLAKWKAVQLTVNYGFCLLNTPRRPYVPVKCQNGFIDDGEECDCGDEQTCKLLGNHCCNFTTCKFYPGNDCDVGTCCNNCTFKPSGSICRTATSPCDLSEYCNGESAECAQDTYVNDGQSCRVATGDSYCYHGSCHTLNKQCHILWGDEGTQNSPFCHQKINVLGVAHGFCKLLAGNSYKKCSHLDSLCGKLQCTNVKSARTAAGVLPIDAKIGSVRCRSAYLKQDNIALGGMVLDGTKCAENRVCIDNKCKSTSEVFQKPACPNDCSGNGICNNNGHCHCNAGYGCPNCTEKCKVPNIGGSIDSGNECHCKEPTTTVTTIITTTPKIVTTTPEILTTTPQISNGYNTSMNITSAPTEVKGEDGKGGKFTDSTTNTVALGSGVFVFIAICVLCFVFRKKIKEAIAKRRAKQEKSRHNKNSQWETRVTFNGDAVTFSEIRRV